MRAAAAGGVTFYRVFVVLVAAWFALNTRAIIQVQVQVNVKATNVKQEQTRQDYARQHITSQCKQHSTAP